MKMWMQQVAVLATALSTAVAFSLVGPMKKTTVTSTTSTSTCLFSCTSPEMDRRSLFTSTSAAATVAASILTTSAAQPAIADGSVSKVVVAGANGQSGRRVLERLAGKPNVSVLATVRNVEKASADLAKSSTVIRGAMVQQVGSVDTTGVDFQKLDVIDDSVDDMATLLKGADSMVIALAYIPGFNPKKNDERAHAVDNVGTIKLIDAAKAAGIKKVVLISSILTNGRNWGQADSPGFVITNAFGHVLDEKIVAENYLRSSGLDYTIVRAGGLKSKPPTGALKIMPEDTVNAGEVSRDLVADVCVASLTDPKASNKVLEIIEDDEQPPKVFNGLVM